MPSVHEHLGKPAALVTRRFTLDGLPFFYQVYEYESEGMRVVIPYEVQKAKGNVVLMLLGSIECGPERFRFMRKTAGISRKEIATGLGLDPVAIEGWEAGDEAPNEDQLQTVFAYVKDQLLTQSQGPSFFSSHSCKWVSDKATTPLVDYLGVECEA